MPMALGASLLVLLGSLSLQTVALQSHLGQADSQELRQQEDKLASAAQQLVADLNRFHPCLLSLPLASWSQQGLACATPEQLDALQRVEQPGGGWQLIAWRPGLASAEILIELRPLEPRLVARRGAFAVALRDGPVQAQFPRLLGLRGVAP